ncbi:MAG TPA: hypothetical protein VMF69_12080 [Gemmataceae bacterium]|nr:hypothetical protein [Gemmataceae bacterium]
MPPIPEFQTYPDYPFPLLPDGVYSTDETAFRVRFVDRFAGSQTRGGICQGFFMLRTHAGGHSIVAIQWVDGSFVEGKQNPGDVDVVSFCDYDFLNGLDTQGQEFVVQYLGGGEMTKARYQTHSFLVASCSVDHHYYAAFEAARAYWRKWFGRTRDVPNPPGPNLPGRTKGFIQMTLGDPNRAPDINT